MSRLDFMILLTPDLILSWHPCPRYWLLPDKRCSTITIKQPVGDTNGIRTQYYERERLVSLPIRRWCQILEPTVRLELTTYRLQGDCSANWAMLANGSRDWTRTSNLQINSLLNYLLFYTGILIYSISRTRTNTLLRI